MKVGITNNLRAESKQIPEQKHGVGTGLHQSTGRRARNRKLKAGIATLSKGKQ